MNKVKNIAVCMALILLMMAALTGCEQTEERKTPEQIFDECSSGVVLIYCKYYYSVTFPNGRTMYISGIEEDGTPENLTPDENEIKQMCHAQFGTGFFIDSLGSIMTNRHVVSVELNESEAQQRLASFMRRERQAYLDSMNSARQMLTELESMKISCYSYNYFTGSRYVSDEATLQEIERHQENLRGAIDEWERLSDSFEANADPERIRIRTISKLGVAYNNTYVESEDDFFGANTCIVRKISQRENTDLAIIQLKNKKTPENMFVFDVSGHVKKHQESRSIGEFFHDIFLGKNEEQSADGDELKIDQQLYMIGYNHGIELAQTREGIKAQMTSGKVTQLPDGERLLYSIPTMQGSSGSPVIDEDGNLRGVNFAKATLSDDFNFGIPMKLVLAFRLE